MANPVAYNQGTSIAGSLKSSVISVGVSPSLNISGYNWRNGFENNNIWVIYSDTFSQGQTTQGNAVPTIWATPVFTDAGLLNLINVLPDRAGQTAFTTLSSAISWLYGENKYFLSNQNYPPIVTDGLSFIVDAGFAASYPNAGTSTYDLGVQQFTNTMQNGLVWTNNNTKSYFDFDGADDQIFINNYNNFSNITWSAGMTVQVLYKIDDLNDFNGQFRAMMGTDSSPRSFNYYLYGPSNPATTLLYHFSANFNSGLSSAVTVQPDRYYLGTFSCGTSSGTYYHNLDVVNSQAGSTPQFYTGPLQYLGRADNSWKGNIGNWKIYNKALSADEIAQNYYQAPIVTSGLVFNIDAANLVSYPSVGTAAYNLTGSNILTLSNGLSYQSGYGGYFLSDGTDDGLTTPDASNLDLSTFTLEGWVWWNQHKNYGSLLVKGPGGSGQLFNYCFFFYAGNIICGFGDGSSFYNVSINTPTTNTWHHIVGTYDGTTLKFYLDGVLATSSGIVATPYQNTHDLNVIQTAYPIDGRVANARVYNRALTATEVLQNYGATRGRFQFYGAYANGGTVTTITQNGVNYRVHTFTSSGTLSVTQSGSVEVLVVAGGGGGGNNHAGGGGAGGLIFDNSYYVINNQSIAVTIGAGGTSPVLNTSPVTNGNNSVFGTLTAIGGGGGGSRNDSNNNSPGNNGGSGGGGGGSQDIYPGNHVPGNGTFGQGNNGGYGINILGGGGGGASAVGTIGAYNSTGGNGGNGIQFNLNGTSTYYAGGGGGGYNPVYGGGNGGLGGGGNGGILQFDQGTPGTANTGGGGGGGGAGGTQGSIGGSGIVIVRYPIY